MAHICRRSSYLRGDILAMTRVEPFLALGILLGVNAGSA